VAGAAFGATRDDGVVIDDRELRDDQGGTIPPPPAEPSPLAGDSEPPTVLAQRPLGNAPDFDNVAAATSAYVPKPALPRRVSINPYERKGNVLLWVLAAAEAAGGGVYLLVAPGSKPLAEAAPSSAPKPAAPRVARKTEPKKSAEVTRNECVAQHFPHDAFDGRPDLAFVCEDGDFPATARRLSAMVLVGDAPPFRDGGVGSDAGIALDVVRLSGMRVGDAGVGSGLDWYELPATAIIRRACCPGSSPVTLPETVGWCEQLESVVRRMADDSARAMDLSPAARNFDRAVNCLLANRVKHTYAYAGAPAPASRAAFQQFLGRAAIISTRR
jgi:hypothetical protein